MWKMAGTVMGPASRARREAARAVGEPWDVLLWRDWTVCRKSLVAADESVPQSKCL